MLREAVKTIGTLTVFALEILLHLLWVLLITLAKPVKKGENKLHSIVDSMVIERRDSNRAGHR